MAPTQCRPRLRALVAAVNDLQPGLDPKLAKDLLTRLDQV